MKITPNFNGYLDNFHLDNCCKTHGCASGEDSVCPIVQGTIERVVVCPSCEEEDLLNAIPTLELRNPIQVQPDFESIMQHMILSVEKKIMEIFKIYEPMGSCLEVDFVLSNSRIDQFLAGPCFEDLERQGLLQYGSEDGHSWYELTDLGRGSQLF